VVNEHTVIFDLAPTATGAYYVMGGYVMHQGRVCYVVGTTRLGGTRFRASLRVVPSPTPAQRRAAEEWRRSNPPAR
jgi:hypothetical protein